MKRPASASCQDTSLGFLFEESAFTVGSVTPQRQSVQSSSTGSALAFSEIKSSASSSFTDFISPALSQSPMEENVEELAAVRRRLWNKKLPLLFWPSRTHAQMRPSSSSQPYQMKLTWSPSPKRTWAWTLPTSGSTSTLRRKIVLSGGASGSGTAGGFRPSWTRWGTMLEPKIPCGLSTI